MDKYNSEGYPDPTAYEALSNIERDEKNKKHVYLPIVYICSPFAGDTERNILQARKYCKFAIDGGRIPLAPHLLYPQFMDDSDPAQRKAGLRFALILLTKCDELWVFGKLITEGMNAEITKALYKGIPVKFYSEDCKEMSL